MLIDEDCIVGADDEGLLLMMSVRLLLLELETADERWGVAGREGLLEFPLFDGVWLEAIFFNERF